MLISKAYRDTCRLMHQRVPDFGTSAIRHWLEPVRVFVKQYLQVDPNYTVLDYGCGKNDFAVELGLPVERYDPGILEFSALPPRSDLVLCIDVLEHIEPNLIDDVFIHLADLTQVAAFLVISVRKAGHTLPDGRNAHLLIQPQEWWMWKLDHYFDTTTVLSEKENDHFSCIVTQLPEREDK